MGPDLLLEAALVGGAPAGFPGAEKLVADPPGPVGSEGFGGAEGLASSLTRLGFLALDSSTANKRSRAPIKPLLSLVSLTTFTMRSWKFGFAPPEFLSKTTSVAARSVVEAETPFRSESFTTTAVNLLS
jgi:hypothetical protein